MLILITKPETYVETTKTGIIVWALTVAPSLLPFFFLTSLLTYLGVVKKIIKTASPVTKFLYNESGVSFWTQIMSFLSGYPVGAKIIADLYQNNIISSKTATKLSIISSTSGPLFIVGSVGVAMFKNKTVGLLLLVSHYLSSIILGVLFRNYGDNQPIAPLLHKNNDIDNILYDCIWSAVSSVLVVGGFIAVFYTLSQILLDFNLLFFIQKPLSLIFGSQLSYGITMGLIESTTGCLQLAKCGISNVSVSLASAIISFGGISIWFQSIAFLTKAKVNIKIFMLGKILQTIISFLVCFLLSLIFI